MTVPSDRIVQDLDAAVLCTDRRGVVQRCNAAAVKLFGRDLTGACLSEETLSEDVPEAAALAECFRRAEPSRDGLRELVVIQSGEEPRYLWLCFTPAGTGEESTGWVLVAQDISAPLAGSPAVRKVFSQVNHDIRSPLTSIGGAAELLLSGRVGEVAGVQRRLVTIIEEGTRKIADILTRTKGELSGEARAESARQGRE